MARTMADLARDLDIVWFDTDDIATTGRTWAEFRGKGEHIALPGGDKGAPGLLGAPAPTFRFLGIIDDASQLPDYYTEADTGKGYMTANTRRLWVWRNGVWTEAGRVVGPQGERGQVHSFADTAHVETLSSGKAPTVEITGTPGIGGEQLHIGIPRGAKGPKGVQGIPGPGARIVDSLDYGGAPIPKTDEVLLWEQASARWLPSKVLPSLFGPWVFPEEHAGWTASASNQTAARTLGSFTVPAQTYAWRPMLFGTVLVSVSTNNRIQGVRVRLNDADAGARVAQCEFIQSVSLAGLVILPGFPGATLTPEDATTGVVPANTAATFHMQTFLLSGEGGSYSYSKTGANLTVFAVPV